MQLEINCACKELATIPVFSRYGFVCTKYAVNKAEYAWKSKKQTLPKICTLFAADSALSTCRQSRCLPQIISSFFSLRQIKQTICMSQTICLLCLLVDSARQTCLLCLHESALSTLPESSLSASMLRST